MRSQFGRLIRWLGAFVMDTNKLGVRFAVASLKLSHIRGDHVVVLPDIGPIVFRPGDSDISVIRQVFGTSDYDTRDYVQYERIKARYDELLAQGLLPVIIDAGANIGASAMYFADAFPGARVVAIEPDPDNARVCAMNTSSRTNVRLWQAALGGTPGQVSLESRLNISWGVRTYRSADGEVPIVTILQLIDAEGPTARLFLVKIDIEGFEAEVFEHAEDWIGLPAVIIVEIHDWLLPGEKTSRSLFRATANLECDVLIRGENLVFIQ